MGQVELLEEVQNQVERMLEIAEDYGVREPLHTEITLYDDDDFYIEIKHSKPLDESSDKGFEKVEQYTLHFQKSEGTYYFRKILREEPNPTREIVEEEKIDID